MGKTKERGPCTMPLCSCGVALSPRTPRAPCVYDGAVREGSHTACGSERGFAHVRLNGKGPNLSMVGPPALMAAVMAGQPAAGSPREEFVEYLRAAKEERAGGEGARGGRGKEGGGLRCARG